MKNLIYCISLAILCLSLTACKDPFKNEQLPPATQTGENTFGFKLDGEVWLPSVEGFDFAGRKALVSNFSENLNRLTITARKFENSKNLDQFFSIVIDSVFLINSEISQGFITEIRYRDSNNEIDQVYRIGLVENDNLININRLDPINKIISGTFEFSLNDGSKTIRITEGRFDFTYPFQSER